ncbi:MAG: metallophosphoesterase [Candidatus Binatia bacterium]
MSSKKLAAYLAACILAVFLFSQWPAGVYIQDNRQATNNATLIGGPMVQIGNTDGIKSIVITWRTLQPSSSRIDFGESSANEQTIIVNEITDRHAVVLRDLQPDTRYQYQVRSDNIVLAGETFQTGKVGDTPFKFAVFGDSGSGEPQQYRVARQMEQQNVDFVLHTGDLVYRRGADKDYPLRFYHPYKNLLARIPFFPAIGNHDTRTANGQPWLDNFVLPGEERFYSFSYGNAFFVALDSNRVNVNSARWLEAQLAGTGKLWKFVFFHEPPFSNHIERSGSAGVRRLWVPLFEKYNVDIVFSGHDHMYTRFKPRDGVAYVIEGLGGRSLSEERPHANDVAFTDNSEYGFGLIDIAGPELVFRHMTANGNVLDTFTLKKHHSVATSLGMTPTVRARVCGSIPLEC